MKVAKSVYQVFQLFANFELDGITPYKHCLAAMYSFKMVASKVKFWPSFRRNFFRIAGTLEADTLRWVKKPDVYLLYNVGGDEKVRFLK